MFPILTINVPGSLDTESLKSETAEIYVKNKSKPTITDEELMVKQSVKILSGQLKGWDASGDFGGMELGGHIGLLLKYMKKTSPSIP